MERVLNSRRKTFYSCPLYMNVSKVPRGRIWEGTHATLAGVGLQDILAAQSEIAIGGVTEIHTCSNFMFHAQLTLLNKAINTLRQVAETCGIPNLLIRTGIQVAKSQFYGYMNSMCTH